VEIRHTAVRAYKEQLLERSRMVDALMSRLRAVTVAE
jgi:hypothetical protein